MFHWDGLTHLLRRYNYFCGVEIGVREGRCASNLLAANPHLKLVGVDRMCPNPDADTSLGQETYAGWPWEKNLAKVHALEKKYAGRYWLLQMESGEAAEVFPDGAFDFVFIDADHSYAGVKRDIELWAPKVRFGGMVSGHDIEREDTVQKAVREAYPNYLTKGKTWNNLWYTFND